eukprot:CAMPEP_0197050898 /NCGR_PEP_ID=MMETSP1384-20130603/25695_1 /TAXON_ID=29189 /ORGANISM="Ammonia sp." /LENGTH=76 /DNA_ID=CAMNT_0042483377 /DNA_START=46 /DNA_END=272 /DNA_ORIENTATION=+
MACRNKTKAFKAAKQITRDILSSPHCRTNPHCDEHKLDDALDVMVLDLASLDSIDAFAQQFADKYERLNYLILNAG